MTTRKAWTIPCLVVLAAVLAGCSSPSENSDLGAGESRPTETVAEATHDFQQGDADVPFTVPEDGTYDISVAFEPANEAGTCGEQTVRITVVRPDGNVDMDVYSQPATELNAVRSCGDQVQRDVMLPAGEWTALFRGESNLRGVVLVERTSG